MPIARQETGLNLSRLAEGEVDPIGRPGLALYRGACYCGKNRFEVHLRETQITNAVACNCSLCHKAGYLWAFPGAGDLNYYNTGSAEKSLVVDTVALGEHETGALRHQVCEITCYSLGLVAEHVYILTRFILTLQFCSSCGTGLYGIHKAGPLESQPGINVSGIRHPSRPRMGVIEHESKLTDILSSLLWLQIRSILGISPSTINPEKAE